MKKAVITVAGLQYVVAEGDTINVNRLDADKKSYTFEAMLLIDDKKTTVGTPVVAGSRVVTEVTDAEARGEKVTAIRFKAKKRVTKVRGHKQSLTTLKIKSIA
ncbi:50S ribosomal protein L21 [bacterium]|nr:50S ribosomal protein L21 [bacterium]NBX97746.1 50S ribosomal protein L21 [bacterium]NDC94952.1 50S ribosomal protein L21 [bacterium]NDD84687.1 50S ribosomal protein L21 [bacterium]NDG30781.1 50S ribosomal protein L21 [bacterium]